MRGFNGQFISLQMFHHRRRKKTPQIPSPPAPQRERKKMTKATKWREKLQRKGQGLGPGHRSNEGRPKGRNDVRRELSQLPTNFAGASRHRPKPRSTLQIAMSYCRLLWTDCILMYLYIYVYISISICIYLYRDSLSIYLPSYLSTFLWIGCLDCHFPSVGT